MTVWSGVVAREIRDVDGFNNLVIVRYGRWEGGRDTSRMMNGWWCPSLSRGRRVSEVNHGLRVGHIEYKGLWGQTRKRKQ